MRTEVKKPLIYLILMGNTSFNLICQQQEMVLITDLVTY